MFLVRERWAGGGDRLLYWPQVLLTIAALLSHLCWVAHPWVIEGPKPSVCRWLSIRHLVTNWLQLQLTQAVSVLVIFLFDVHLLPLFFRLFTQVHLLIDGSVECQYVTLIRTLYCWVLSKEVSRTIFKVFDMMRPGIEPRSPGPLAKVPITSHKQKIRDKNRMFTFLYGTWKDNISSVNLDLR